MMQTALTILWDLRVLCPPHPQAQQKRQHRSSSTTAAGSALPTPSQQVPSKRLRAGLRLPAPKLGTRHPVLASAAQASLKRTKQTAMAFCSHTIESIQSSSRQRVLLRASHPRVPISRSWGPLEEAPISASPTSQSRACMLESSRILSALTSRWMMVGLPPCPAWGWWRYCPGSNEAMERRFQGGVHHRNFKDQLVDREHPTILDRHHQPPPPPNDRESQPVRASKTMRTLPTKRTMRDMEKRTNQSSPHLESFGDVNGDGQPCVPAQKSTAAGVTEVPLEAPAHVRIDQHGGGMEADPSKGHQIVMPA